MASRRGLGLTILDWLLVIATPAIALALLNVNPDSHDFSVIDLNISYGHRERAKVSLPLLIFLAVVVPILIITTLSVYPFSSISGSAWGRPSSAQLRGLNASLLGLGISLATATVVLNVKNLAGIPRPDFLERCRPDVDNIAAYTVGEGYGRSLSSLWVMVNREICQADSRDVNEGFRSFPSGYATIAFAGLWYLTLYLSARFRIAAPHYALSSSVVSDGGAHRHAQASGDENDGELEDLLPHTDTLGQRQARLSIVPLPTFLLILPYVSLGLAIFIAGTRYFDFRNHGFDVLAGAAAGSTTASFAFRLYGHGAATL